MVSQEVKIELPRFTMNISLFQVWNHMIYMWSLYFHLSFISSQINGTKPARQLVSSQVSLQQTRKDCKQIQRGQTFIMKEGRTVRGSAQLQLFLVGSWNLHSFKCRNLNINFVRNFIHFAFCILEIVFPLRHMKLRRDFLNHRMNYSCFIPSLKWLRVRVKLVLQLLGTSFHCNGDWSEVLYGSENRQVRLKTHIRYWGRSSTLAFHILIGH